MLDRGKDTPSLSDFKRNTGGFLKQIHADGHPLVLTVNGRAELVVQDAGAYRELLARVDELEALEGIKRGLADVTAGQVVPLEKFEKDFRKKHEISRRAGPVGSSRRG